MKKKARPLIVSLADARTYADLLFRGAVADHSQWSARRAHVVALHTLCYQLIANAPSDVAIGIGGAR